jgi:branched-chain amino acid transport system permease protein
LVCIAFGGIVMLAYGLIFGPILAGRDPLVKAIGTLGLTLIFLGIMSWIWGERAGTALTLPTTKWSYTLPWGLGVVNWTQIIGLAFGVLVTAATAAFLRFTKLGTAMRALANDREITATLGVPVRRVETAAWLGCGLVCGVAGLLLSNLLALDIPTLTFFFISAIAAALIARLRSLWVTLVAALLIGLVEALLTPFYGNLQFLTDYRSLTPFVFAIVALLWLGRRRVVTVSRAAR